jgi:hypothetical protein
MMVEAKPLKRISKQEAASLCLKRYFTGKPCVHGHICERYISSGACVECIKDRIFYERERALEDEEYLWEDGGEWSGNVSG